jgi:peptidyl-prolyl cis-trans isomerase D
MMMQGLRNAGQTWLGKSLIAILFGFLIVSFAIWGIGDIFRGQARTAVALVGKTEISIDQVRSAYQVEVQRISRRLRQNLTPDMARAFGIDQQVLSRLITDTVLDKEAGALGLLVGDDMVRQAIVDDQTFRDAGGRFNRAAFNELLRQANINEATYVREQRGTMLRLQLAEAIAGAPTVPLAMLEAAHRYANEQRVIQHVTLAPAAAGDIAEPTDEQLMGFFNERRASFRAQEFRTAQVLVLTPATLANPAAVQLADLEAHYNATRQRYGAPERRTIQQIVFPNRAEADAAVARIRSGLTFEDLAKERTISDTDLTLGSFTRTEMLDQSVAAAAFGLQANAVSDPVQGAFGFAVLRITAVEAESVRPLADVADLVRADLAQQQAVRRLAEVHDKIEDMRASARPLAEIAREVGIPTIAYGPVDRTRRTPAGQQGLEVPASDRLAEAMFRADIGTDNEAVRTPDNGYIWYDVTTIDQARERTLAEVRDTVVQQWRREEIATRLQARARELTDRLGRGESFEAVAASAGLTATASPALTRGGNNPEFPSNVVTVAFGLPVNGASSATLPEDRGRMVFVVQSASVTPFLRTTQEAERAQEQMALAVGDDLLSQFVSAAQARHGVTINQQNLRNATGGGEG